MAILVTGDAGYIGSHMSLPLAERGIEFVVLDDFSSGHRKSVQGHELVEGEVGNAALLRDLFEANDISAVMHFAGSIDVAESVVNPAKYYTNNVVATQRLLDCMVTHGVTRFVFSSSGRTGECHNPETHLIPLVLQVASGRRDSITVFGTDYDTPDGTCTGTTSTLLISVTPISRLSPFSTIAGRAASSISGTAAATA